MATLFQTLFDEFLETEINSLDLSKYSPPYLSRYLTKLLTRAREEFYNLAYSNSGYTNNKMDDIVDFYNREYNFFVSSTPTESFLLSPNPVNGSEFYITNNDVELNSTDYIYNEETGIITINNLTEIDSEIIIISFKNGQFNQTLNLIEKSILIDWMGVIVQKDKIKEQKLYNMSLYGRDEGMGSQANHLKSLQNGYKEDRKNIETKTIEYTFRNSPDNLQGMGARGGVYRR